MSPHAARLARRRARVESVIRLVAPVLDVVLIVGDRVSRWLEPEDPGYVTPRMGADGEAAPRGLRTPPARGMGARHRH